MNNKLNETMKFQAQKDSINSAKEIILSVFESLQEKGYDPINQIIGYILSGDPTYITSHNDARSMICRIERDELLEEVLKAYLPSIKK
jgi:uncharacterized protein (UPF0297 family)